jgi:hypothetical protein
MIREYLFGRANGGGRRSSASSSASCPPPSLTCALGFMSDRTTRLVVGAVGAAALLFVAACGLLFVLMCWPDWRIERRAQGLLAQSESAVAAKMGAPTDVVTAAQVGSKSDKSWWYSGYHPAPSYPVTHKVLVYYGTWTKAFIYVGTNGLVEHVHLAGT